MFIVSLSCRLHTAPPCAEQLLCSSLCANAVAPGTSTVACTIETSTMVVPALPLGLGCTSPRVVRCHVPLHSGCHVPSRLLDGLLLLQDWQVPLGRRFRALKVWFVLRTYGQQGLQSYIEHHLRLAGMFQGLVEADERFELTAPPKFGLVCFALKVRARVSQASLCLRFLVGEMLCLLLTWCLAT